MSAPREDRRESTTGENALLSGTTESSSNSKYKYFSVSLCKHRAAFVSSVHTQISNSNSNGEGGGRAPAHHQERLHLVFLLDGDRVYVEDARVPARLDPAVRLDRAENLPAVPSVLLVARQPVREEQRLDRLGAQDVPRVVRRRRPRPAQTQTP